MVREMIGGCCVCLDERGWSENPLVYCDGHGCNVAVHQACYGIVKVPVGPWFCCKCRSQERIARVKCELCPSKEGALKRTDNGGWAHVLCALYIPEVRFGDVSTMDPIILSSVPHERFQKACYICEESGRESKTACGACMTCHKAGCKLSFHVTCAQSKRLLCEEASLNGNVQYVGYCSTHWSKKEYWGQPSATKPMGSTPATDQDFKKGCKEGPRRFRADSTSSTNSETGKGKLRKANSLDQVASVAAPFSEAVSELSPCKGEPAPNISSSSEGKGISQGCLSPSSSGLDLTNKPSAYTNGALMTEKVINNSPLNTPVSCSGAQSKKDNSVKKAHSLCNGDHKSSHAKQSEKRFKEKEQTSNSSTKDRDKKLGEHKKRKPSNEKPDRPSKKSKLLLKERHELDGDRQVETLAKDGKSRADSASKGKDSTDQKLLFAPLPSHLNLVENGRVTSWEDIAPKLESSPDNFQDFLEYQWNQSAQFVTSKATHYDVASLLTCLHQLKMDNMKLEKRLASLQSRRDRLLGVNARLSQSFADAFAEENGRIRQGPLSAMLSKLADSAPSGGKAAVRSCGAADGLPNGTNEQHHAMVQPPDLAMLAAASARVENYASLGQTAPSPNGPSRKSHAASAPDQMAAVLDSDASSLVQPYITNYGAQRPLSQQRLGSQGKAVVHTKGTPPHHESLTRQSQGKGVVSLEHGLMVNRSQSPRK